MTDDVNLLMDDSAGRAARNMSAMVTGRLVVQGALLVSTIVIPRVLGLETFGLYAALMAVVAMLDALATGGLQMAEIRFFAPAWRSVDKTRAIRLASSIWFTRLALALASGLAASAWLAFASSLEAGLQLAVLTGWVVVTRAALEGTRHLFLSMGEVGRMVLFELVRVIVTLFVVVAVFGWSGDLTLVFVALPLGYLAILVPAIRQLLGRIPIRMRHVDWSALHMMLRFSALTLLGSVAWATQAQFATFAVANWVSLAEGALLAMTIQIYMFFQTLVVAVRSSLLPVLAEIDEAGRRDRVRTWGSLMMRFGTAATVLAALGWALSGELVLQVLPSDFSPVYESGAVMMFGVVAMTGASACNGLLYVGGFAGWASLSRLLFAAVTVGGVLVLVDVEGGATAFRVAALYAVAALAFFTVSYTLLAVKRGMRLPLRRALLLTTPLLGVWPVVGWDVAPGLKLLAFAPVATGYLWYAVVLRLLPREELVQVTSALRSSLVRAS